MHSTDTIPDGEATPNRSYFMKTTERTDTDILKGQVIVIKDEIGARVSREYGIQYGFSIKQWI